MPGLLPAVVVAHHAAQLDAGDVGHVDVEDDDVGRVLVERLPELLLVVDGEHLDVARRAARAACRGSPGRRRPPTTVGVRRACSHSDSTVATHGVGTGRQQDVAAGAEARRGDAIGEAPADAEGDERRPRPRPSRPARGRRGGRGRCRRRRRRARATASSSSAVEVGERPRVPTWRSAACSADAAAPASRRGRPSRSPAPTGSVGGAGVGASTAVARSGVERRRPRRPGGRRARGRRRRRHRRRGDRRRSAPRAARAVRRAVGSPNVPSEPASRWAARSAASAGRGVAGAEARLTNARMSPMRPTTSSRWCVHSAASARLQRGLASPAAARLTAPNRTARRSGSPASSGRTAWRSARRRRARRSGCARPPAPWR